MGKKLTKLGKISKDTWNSLAREDAEFYILTEKDKKGGRWNKNEFLDKGQEQWMRFKKLLSRYGLKHYLKDKIALDMGCGVGRVTFAMAKDFSKVVGVDVSEDMIEKAGEYRNLLGCNNVEFMVNNGVDLSHISNDSMDFVFSYLTLQHSPSSRQVLNYVKEFSRVLRTGGGCIFQVRVSPTFKRHFRFILSKNKAKIRRIFKNDYHLEHAFVGNWVYYPRISKVISERFSFFYLIHTPIELYQERFWELCREYERWKRTFWICIK